MEEEEVLDKDLVAEVVVVFVEWCSQRWQRRRLSRRWSWWRFQRERKIIGTLVFLLVLFYFFNFLLPLPFNIFLEANLDIASWWLFQMSWEHLNAKDTPYNSLLEIK